MSRPRLLPHQAITQQMLERYVSLKKLEKERKDLRIEMIDLIAKGAEIESGVYEPSVRTSIRLMFTMPVLQEILGPASIDTLRQLVPRSEVHVLSVRPCAGQQRKPFSW